MKYLILIIITILASSHAYAGIVITSYLCAHKNEVDSLATGKNTTAGFNFSGGGIVRQTKPATGAGAGSASASAPNSAVPANTIITADGYGGPAPHAGRFNQYCFGNHTQEFRTQKSWVFRFYDNNDGTGIQHNTTGKVCDDYDVPGMQ